MRHRPPAPLLIAACGVCGGLMAQRAAGEALPDWVWLAMAIISSFFVLVPRRAMALRWMGIVFVFSSTAALNASFRSEVGHEHIRKRLILLENKKGVDVTIAGRIVSEPRERGGRLTFVLDTACLQLPASCPAISGKLRVTVQSELRLLFEDDGVVVRGLLQVAAARRNPADFDFAGWLASSGVSGLLVDATVVQVCRTERRWLKFINNVRTDVRGAIRRVVPLRSQDLPLALLLGDRSMLTSDTRTDFARSGLMHLLAISGLHVMLVGMTLHRLLRPFLMRTGCRWRVVEGIRSGLTLLLLIVYALVTGSSPSVVRAVTMTSFLLAGTVAGGISNPLNSLGGAALAILLFDPTDLHQPGFQLSFSAVIGLVLLGRGFDVEVLTRVRSRPGRWVISSASASVAATLATTPALLLHFGYVGVSGVLLNIVAIPVGAALLSACILLYAVSMVSIHAAVPLGSGVDLLSLILKWLAAIGARPDILVLSPSSVTAFSIVSILVLIALVTIHRGMFRRWVLIAATAPPVVALLLSLASGQNAPRLDVLFLDVGHGDAAIVKLPGGRVILSDAGNRNPFRDEGKRTVIPNLPELEVRHVDLAVVSHPHADHLGGIPALLRDVSVGCVADNGQSVDSRLFAETLAVIEQQDLCRRVLSAGDTIDLDPRVRILVLAPPSTSYVDAANDRSVVLKIVFGKSSLILTGDIERQAEEFLAQRYCDLLTSDVVKVPHHGSRTSSSTLFVECVTAKSESGYALISVGSPLKYGLPDEEIIERWNATRLKVHSTFAGGALWLQSDGVRFVEKRWPR